MLTYTIANLFNLVMFGVFCLAGAVFRFFLSSDLDHAAADCSGDQVKYKVFAVREQDFLERVSAAVEALPVCSSEGGADMPPLTPIASIDAVPAAPAVTSAEEPSPMAVQMDRVDQPEGAVEEEDMAGFSLFDDLPEPAPAASNAMWACAVCTLMNDPGSTECVVCTTPRVALGRSVGGAAPASAAAGWWCGVCTFISSLSATR